MPVQVLSYSKYSLFVLLVVGIEPSTFRWLYSEAPSNQNPYLLRQLSLSDEIQEFSYKHLNISVFIV